MLLILLVMLLMELFLCCGLFCLFVVVVFVCFIIFVVLVLCLGLGGVCGFFWTNCFLCSFIFLFDFLTLFSCRFFVSLLLFYFVF